MSPDIATDIPSPIDFDDPAQVRAWIDATVEKRPWRPRFFAAFVNALNASFDRSVRIAELGAGPGHLAKAIMDGCNVSSYTAIDLSLVMLDLARQHVGDSAGRLHVARRDFRGDDWADGLGPFDAIVTMQAAHEVRHKSRQPALLATIYNALEPGGLLLFCDHYAEADSSKNSDLYLTRQEHPALLANAGFRNIEPLLDQGGMALIQARKA